MKRNKMRKFENSNLYVTENGEVFVENRDGSFTEAKRYIAKNGKEYVQAIINKKGRCYAIDSLVLRVFGNAPTRKKYRVRHLNGNLLDNRLCNLDFEGSKEEQLLDDEQMLEKMKEEIIDLRNRLVALNEWSKLKVNDLEERVTANKDRIETWISITFKVDAHTQEQMADIEKDIEKLNKEKKDKLFIKKER